jgi:ABC-type bacteriocin/lantibiotic exporter with double-glycine peptidase domain
MSDQLSKLLYRALKEYGCLITYSAIERELKSHPDFPSMLSLSDVLDEWKVKHGVMRVTVEKLREMDVPAIAYLQNGDFIWVTQITDTKVHYWSASQKKKVEYRNHFEKEWSEVILVIEDVSEAGEPNYREERNQEIKEVIFKYLFSTCMIISISVLMYNSQIKDMSPL